MEYNYKMVNLHKYCPTCKYEDVPEEDDPCNECIDNPVNEHTEKPVKWEAKENV